VYPPPTHSRGQGPSRRPWFRRRPPLRETQTARRVAQIAILFPRPPGRSPDGTEDPQETSTSPPTSPSKPPQGLPRAPPHPLLAPKSIEQIIRGVAKTTLRLPRPHERSPDDTGPLERATLKLLQASSTPPLGSSWHPRMSRATEKQVFVSAASASATVNVSASASASISVGSEQCGAAPSPAVRSWAGLHEARRFGAGRGCVQRRGSERSGAASSAAVRTWAGLGEAPRFGAGRGCVKRRGSERSGAA